MPNPPSSNAARLKTLFAHSAVYGAGDVATSVVSLLLLPVFTRYLSPADYGVLQLLLAAEAVLKPTLRCGLGSSFLRLHYDGRGAEHEERLTGTIFVLQLAIVAPLTGAGFIAAPWLAERFFGGVAQGELLRLVLIKTFAVTFYFIPFQRLRVQNRSQVFAALTFSRSAATLLLRIVFVVFLARGVAGVVVADLIITGVFTVVLGRLAGPRLRPVFSWAIGREALRLGLPHLPAHAARQVISVGDRYLLVAFATAQDVGLYGLGAAIGSALKLVTSALRTAWGPFVLQTMSEPDPKRVYRTLAPYLFSVLVLFGLGLAATGPDIARLMAEERFRPGADVIPLITVGVMLLGLNQLASVGLGIRKRPWEYALAAVGGAAASVGANFAFIPRLGFIGAGFAYVVACAVFTGISIWLSHLHYPISQDWTRIGRVVLAGIASYWMVVTLFPGPLPPVLGILARGGFVCVCFPGLLLMIGFFHRGDVRRIVDAARRISTRPPPHVEDADGTNGPQTTD